VSIEARIEPLSGALPNISWRWDSETDILSGAFKGNRKSGGLTGTVELTDAVVKSGNTTTPRTRFLRPLSVPMPDDLVEFQNRKVEDYRDASRSARSKTEPINPGTDRLVALDRNWYRLTNGIKSEIHARASFSVACWVLVLVGCGLGMMFRSGNFLSAFAISVIPAGMCILLIITGQHTADQADRTVSDLGQRTHRRASLQRMWVTGSAVRR